MVQDRDHDEEPAERLPARPRFGAGTGEHTPLQIDPITHHVVRLVRELQGPIADLGRNLHTLDGLEPESGVDVGSIRDSLHVVESLVRDLCMSLLGMSREPASVSSALSGTSVLVIDPDADQAQTLRSALQEHGVTVMTAMSATESLACLAPGRPDAVILDLALGVSIARTLAVALPELPIIATGTATERRSAAGVLSRANAYLVDKPYRSGELLVLLEQILIAPPGPPRTITPIDREPR